MIANGKQIANGTTIRRNGVVSHFVNTEKEKENKKKEEISSSDVDPIASNGKNNLPDGLCGPSYWRYLGHNFSFLV